MNRPRQTVTSVAGMVFIWKNHTEGRRQSWPYMLCQSLQYRPQRNTTIEFCLTDRGESDWSIEVLKRFRCHCNTSWLKCWSVFVVTATLHGWSVEVLKWQRKNFNTSRMKCWSVEVPALSLQTCFRWSVEVLKYFENTSREYKLKCWSVEVWG